MWNYLKSLNYDYIIPFPIQFYNSNVDYSIMLVDQHWLHKKNNTHKFVLVSPAVSRMSCSSYLDVSGGTPAVLWSVASRIYSRQHVAFFSSPHLAFSPRILFATMWCIHRAVLTQPHFGKNPVLFYRIDQTSI